MEGPGVHSWGNTHKHRLSTHRPKSPSKQSGPPQSACHVPHPQSQPSSIANNCENHNRGGGQIRDTTGLCGHKMCVCVCVCVCMRARVRCAYVGAHALVHVCELFPPLVCLQDSYPLSYSRDNIHRLLSKNILFPPYHLL